MKVNVSKIEPGQQMIAEWRGQPVFIVRRTEEILGNLKKIEGQLSDPTSEKSDQPAYAKNEARSIKPEILLLVGLCTHLGCSPTFRRKWRLSTWAKTGSAVISARATVPTMTSLAAFTNPSPRP